jgi:hypothetical protein
VRQRRKYNINGRYILLFTLSYISDLFGHTPEAIRKKEQRGTIPPAKFRSTKGNRLYSIDEIGIFEYLFKEVFPTKGGVQAPPAIKELIFEVLNITRKEVIAHGRVKSEDVFSGIRNSKFNQHKAMMYINYWHSILDEPEEEED